MICMYLLDTNIVSEIAKPQPNIKVVELLARNQKVSAIPALAWAECLYGIKRLPESRRKDILSDFYYNVVNGSFEFVPFDEHAAVIYSDIKSRLEKAGCPASEIDMQIAATAIANNLILVTRNTGDFSNIAEISSLMLENWFEAE